MPSEGKAKMNKFMISLPDDSGPQDEIEALAKFANRMPEGSYLHMLFTGDFLGWVEQQITADLYPDMHKHWMTDISIAAEKYNKKNRQIIELERMVSIRDRAISDLKARQNSTLDAATKWEQYYRDEQEKHLQTAHKLSQAFGSYFRFKRRVRKLFDERESKWEFLLAKLAGGK